MAALKYRPFIDGLRALSVLSVVAYHYDILQVRGGFVGVDVFFVISGYLITQIIYREAVQGTFSIAHFYERRIRRIFPALFAMLLATAIAAALILLPSDRTMLSDSLLATILFCSNFLFWRRSGYFDPSSDYNPLLHTWSLAVEEQFYIFFPIAILSIARLPRLFLIAALWIAMAISLVACVSLQSWQPSAMFYLAPFRSWELLAGSLVAVGALPDATSDRIRTVVSGGALALLVTSFAVIPDGLTFPGWHATLPVAATAALLWAGRQTDTLVHRALSWAPLRKVGLISYSLYLWHWPVAVLLDYQQGLQPIPMAVRYGMFAFVLMLAWLSYAYVERPFRRPKLHGTRKRSWVFASAAGATLLLAGTAMILRFVTFRQFAPAVIALDEARHPGIPFQRCDAQSPSQQASDCVIRDVRGDTAPVTLLWGDSHALAWAGGFPAGEKKLGTVVLAVKSACPPLVRVTVDQGTGCQEFNERVLAWIAKNRPSTVLLAASWPDYSRDEGLYRLVDEGYREGNHVVFPAALGRTVKQLSSFGGRIVLIGPTPGAPQEPALHLALGLLHGLPGPPPVSTLAANHASSAFWRAARRIQAPNVWLVDPVPWFCDQSKCNYMVDGTLLYRDAGHLNVSGASFAMAKLEQSLLVAIAANADRGTESGAERKSARQRRLQDQGNEGYRAGPLSQNEHPQRENHLPEPRHRQDADRTEFSYRGSPSRESIRGLINDGTRTGRTTLRKPN